MGRRISLDIRRKIVDDYFVNKDSVTKISKRYNVCRDTVYSLIKLFEKTNDIKPLPYKSRLITREKTNDFNKK